MLLLALWLFPGGTVQREEGEGEEGCDTVRGHGAAHRIPGSVERQLLVFVKRIFFGWC